MWHLFAQLFEVAFYIVVIFSLIVFIHELGHFLIARRFGVKVDIFSIGFGKELFGWTDKKGTRWRFSLIPLGGYVQFFGDEDATSKETEKAKSLTEKEKAVCINYRPAWQRILVSVGGPLGNYILAFFLVAFVFFSFGKMEFAPKVGNVAENSPAATLGLQKGDKINTFNGVEIDTYNAFLEAVNSQTTQPEWVVEVERNGETVILKQSPAPVFNESLKFGASPDMDMKFTNPMSFGTSLKAAYGYIVNLTKLIAHNIYRLITGSGNADDLSGPVGIANTIKQASEYGIETLIFLTALLSLSLGFINMVPLPPLDGGHILLAIIESLRGGRKVSLKVQEAIFAIGITLIVGLMLFSTYKDILKLTK